MRLASSTFVRLTLVVGAFFFSIVLSTCGDSAVDPNPTPVVLESDDFRSGQYTWTDLTNPLSPIAQFQYSHIKFFSNVNQDLTFLLRVDTSIANPARRFNDLTAKYTFRNDTLLITDSIIILKNGSNNLPFGIFNLRAGPSDSIVFQKQSLLSDTIWRLTIALP